MKPTGLVTLNMRELDRLKVIQAVVDRMLKPGLAAERLNLTVRQVERLVLRYKQTGAAGVGSAARGRPGNRKLDEVTACRALVLIRDRYADFGPTLACEKLRECHGLTLSKETVRHLMTDAGLWIPRKQRPPKIHQPRNRRSCLGELIQIDGSDHRWFEDRAPACTLLVFIDDATSQLMTLHFTATESTFSYFEATRKYIEAHGKPVALYSDKASVFHCNQHASTPDKGVTQYGRALYELNVDTLCANSSQAKGRVERANLTLQDRLVKELRLRKIDTKEAANAYAPHFMADFNGRFAKIPKSAFNAHRPLRGDEDLDLILTHRVLRCVSNSLTLQYDRVIYMLDDTPQTRALAHHYIDVYEYPDGRIEIRAHGSALAYRQYDRLSAMDQGAEVDNKRLEHVLALSRQVQMERDNRRISGSPSRTNQGEPVKPKMRANNTRKQRELKQIDMNAMMLRSAELRAAAVGK
ncbi:ISNCY family transposase [Burkholderia sp. PAMC 26561]|uniref:ISNCY family transposase n=2 Tax=Burkholderiaceae TaxID=119060 RepID=UPI00076B84A9|nr:ISNCY family transposase [Burkholderia sp. PAMC 26561]AME27059.1 transposase [Burkholderia sp. PAMC 26561]AME27796.1 transposase [Burkholderia sp. PAMC 26561]